MADTAGKGSSTVTVTDDAEKRQLKKILSLYETEPLSPITTHGELVPILEKLGFIPGAYLIPQPPNGAVGWMTYIYRASTQWMGKLKTEEEPPTVSLPRPDPIDGLHERIYSAFLKAMKFYLEKDDISSIFHVGIVDVNEGELEGTTWKIDEYSEGKQYMYKPTTLDSASIGLDNVAAIVHWVCTRQRHL